MVIALGTIACSSTPGGDGLRDSFAQQLSANRFVSAFERTGDDLTFKAPAPDGSPATWRVHIDSTRIEKQASETQPFKGTVLSSWYVNGGRIDITGGESNLPIELTSNGLGQECWAFWEADRKRWSWE
jgi:hypothetical protein